MKSCRFILLIADPSLRRTPAFDRACRLALAAQAPLHICLLVRSGTIALAGLLSRKAAVPARCAFLQARRHWLQSEAEALQAKGLEVSCDALWSSNPDRDLMTIVNRLQPELVIKDAEPDETLSGLGSKVQQHLLQTCPVPVLLVRGGSGHEPRTIAAAIDTGRSGAAAAAFNELIFQTAATFAGYHHAELHLIHVQGRHTAPEQDAGNLAAFAQAHQVAPERCHALTGGTVQGLMDLIERNRIDLLVLGRSADTHRLLPWSAPAEQINQSASCDVLTVREIPLNPIRHDNAALAGTAIDDRTPA